MAAALGVASRTVLLAAGAPALANAQSFIPHSIARRASRLAATALAALVLLLVAGCKHSELAPVTFSCTFQSSPTDCGFVEQAKEAGRASLVTVAGIHGVRLHTEPGDSNVAGSGTAERNDLSLSPTATDCAEGREQWWTHSILFPNDYTAPPAPTPGNWTWGVVFDFHHTGHSGQANFHVDAMPDPVGLRFRGYGGDFSNPVEYEAPIGPVVKNVWYQFVYHVKWSSGADGFFDAWVNGVQKLAHRGPTLYAGEQCYLKLANYHSGFGLASSVIHGRVLRGTSREVVSSVSLKQIAEHLGAKASLH